MRNRAALERDVEVCREALAMYEEREANVLLGLNNAVAAGDAAKIADWSFTLQCARQRTIAWMGLLIESRKELEELDAPREVADDPG